MTKEIENIIKKNCIRDIQIKMLKKEEKDGFLINKEVFNEILSEVENELKNETI